MAVRGRRPSRGRGTAAQRRKNVWTRSINSLLTVPANGGIFIDGLSTFETEYGADPIGVTLMRQRGEVVSDQSVVIGARIFTQSTLNQLVSGTHDPGVDVHADWFLWKSIFVTTSGTREPREFDGRAARRLPELGQSILLSVSNLSATAANVSFTMSLLMKLP